MIKKKGILQIALNVILILTVFKGTSQYLNIKNDVFWETTDQKPIYSQGGGIFKFTDPSSGVKKYFWYGVKYKEADVYRHNPAVTLATSTFESVTCYSSSDLVNWKFEGDVLSKETTNPNGKTWAGRLGVVYIQELKKYAMFIQHDKEVLICLADSPVGEFQWHQKINMQKMIGTSNTGDQTVFTDEDSGKSYLIYSYGNGRNKIYVSEIGIKDGKVGLLDCTEVFKGESREGNCMFKYNNKYYMIASNIYGWDASFAYYLVADNIRGPYLPVNEMQVMKGADQDFAHVSQTGFFVSVKGTNQETIVFCGDRWSDFAGNGLGYNQWCPLSFNGDVPYFNSLSSWDLEEKTGNWRAAKDNNYALNGSFEADRRHIPSPVKPVQIQLTGWFSEVVYGNKLSLDSISPVLNHFNTEEERKIVIGEKSLQISDNVDYKRKTFQVLSSTPFVKLADGNYKLSAKVKNTNNFTNLEMYGLSGNKKYSFKIDKENSSWKVITIQNIVVKGGKVEIGFMAEGKAGSSCYVDDIVFIKKS
jgi:hypothetical protein